MRNEIFIYDYWIKLSRVSSSSGKPFPHLWRFILSLQNFLTFLLRKNFTNFKNIVLIGKSTFLRLTRALGLTHTANLPGNLLSFWSTFIFIFDGRYIYVFTCSWELWLKFSHHASRTLFNAIKNCCIKFLQQTAVGHQQFVK